MLSPEEMWSGSLQSTGSDSVRDGGRPGGVVFPAGTSTTLCRLLSGLLTLTLPPLIMHLDESQVFLWKEGSAGSVSNTESLFLFINFFGLIWCFILIHGLSLITLST